MSFGWHPPGVWSVVPYRDVALVGLLRESDAQLVGWLLMVPAMVLGLLGLPPVCYSPFSTGGRC